MSSLPVGQFLDYLIIGVIVAASGALLEPLLKRRVNKFRQRLGAVVVLCVVAAVGYIVVYWAVDSHAVQVTSDPGHPGRDNSNGGTTITTRQENNRPDPESPFIQENLSLLPKGTRKEGQWAILIAEPEKDYEYSELTSVVKDAIALHGQSTVAIFKPSVRHTANFNTLFAADPSLSRMMAQYCDHIFIGRVNRSNAQQPPFPEIMSVSLSLEAKIVSTKSGEVESQFRSREVGAGADAVEARTNAEERLADTLRSRLSHLIH